MARELLLIRHGIAVERGSTATDEERALTSEGRARTRRVLERLERLGLTCGPLVSSPLVRARQTGELALERKLGNSLSFSNSLAPGQDPMPLLRELLEEPWERVGLVGHEPDMGQLASYLLGCQTHSLQLKKAGVALLALDEPLLDPGAAQLRLLLSPKVLLDGGKV
ncbi:MAG: phosphohistidine phosphatase SixA [Cyanobacteria bacterium]|nr:phosphohistidine phosphatase SixA [Cyanobacteriota bacterium]